MLMREQEVNPQRQGIFVCTESRLLLSQSLQPKTSKTGNNLTEVLVLAKRAEEQEINLSRASA